MVLQKTKPSFKIENKHWDLGIQDVIGIDEVGRGAFAGPITAAGVIFKPHFTHEKLTEIRDSKKLSPKKREELSIFIKENSIWAIESVDIEHINKYGIGSANQKVIRKVLSKLMPRSSNYFILIDGFDLGIPRQQGIVNGDNLSISIASASIIAKVYRDKIMCDLAKEFPEYAFDKNKGYGTLQHRNAIKIYKLSKIHRTSFNI